MFGDGREERLSAALLEMRLKNNPKLAAKKAKYLKAVDEAREFSKHLSEKEIIDELLRHNKAYIRSLLETENERYGEGAIQERYARTFYSRFK